MSVFNSFMRILHVLLTNSSLSPATKMCMGSQSSFSFFYPSFYDPQPLIIILHPVFSSNHF